MHKTIFIAVTMLFLVLSVVLSPDVALQASLSGITIWWKLVFPGLLPFLILYELMQAFGLIHGLNALFAPFIARLLRLPQAAAAPLLMSAVSGFPTGVEPTLKLLQEGQLTLQQTQRLLCYIHLPNPVFIVVIIGAGIYQLPLFGYSILAAVWLSSLVLMVIHSRFATSSSAVNEQHTSNKPYFSSAMQLGRELDGRSFGRVLGDSVYSSVQKLFIIGGFIIFASVISTFLHPAAHLLAPNLPFIEQALLEQHIGSFAIAGWAINQGSTVLSLALIAACLSFTGISGILQVTYYTYQHKQLALRSFVSYRLLHASLSFIMLLLLWKPLNGLLSSIIGSTTEAVWLQRANESLQSPLPSIWQPSLLLCASLAVLLLLLHWRRIKLHKA